MPTTLVSDHPAELEMMMDRRHLKTLSARLLKIGYLNNNR